MPPSLNFINASVPIRVHSDAMHVQWVQITISVKGNTKYVTVENNPMGTLRIQPWLGGHKLQSASPKSFAPESPRVHVGWQFVGKAAKAQSVKVSWHSSEV